MNPITTQLHELVTLLRPQLPKDDTTRTSAERTVRVVDGRLVKFKLESGRTGDQDYHLVLTDETLQFSQGGGGTQASPHSFVAEIVNPDCVAGREGTDTVPSRFQAQPQAVYDEFRNANSPTSLAAGTTQRQSRCVSRPSASSIVRTARPAEP